MDYKELADLIFPDVKPISYYEEKYHERNLEEGAIVTRFAPSPTGFVHLGSLYQVVIARKMAKQTNGVFFLRVEDTDQKREVENGVTGIIQSLKDFGLTPDEGMINETEEIGKYRTIQTIFKKRYLSSLCKIFTTTRKSIPMFCNSRRVR